MNFPRKRVILAWHRWMGLVSALFLVVLSITGLALNHTERLGLDTIQLKHSWVLRRYGMAAGSEIEAYRIHTSDTLAHLNGQLFYNGQPLTSAATPLGIIEGDPITVVATAHRLIYLSRDGQLIESLHHSQLPYSKLIAVGRSPDGRPILVAEGANWSPDADWLEFEAYSDSYQVSPLTQTELLPSQTTALLEAFQGGGVSLYRVLLDLHAGRIFGWAGRTVMDLTALAILLLVSSGIAGWLRKSRRKTPTKP
ncbi:PepSY-associated TM helix domain-containing protein [Coraliomargarita sp. SDUM461003]|uniref:PepSY-associated TM helix domain-containing protein n=1 Tax=Thalassobacterium maritimum TaxID=3041265 RepID=A0ABU1AVY3_9BACT|nr:PepSY-associated TM helix domain-containing protein [Coraliomargarita sp. SDUM461003]MDQ8207142.1 PepSY-associated TM helix domain-containing protein [Coraliomargarita sp. SDUM461003]